MRPVFFRISRLAQACIVYLAVFSLYLLVSLRFKDLFVALQALVLILLPRIFSRLSGIYIPAVLESGLVLIVMGTLVLGEMYKLYEIIWWWDLLLHAFSGFVLALIAGIVLSHAFAAKKPTATKRQNLFILVSSAILISIGLSGIWEVYEYIIDQLFGSQMQPSGGDTMHDLIVGTVGAFIAWPLIRHFINYFILPSSSAS